MQGKRVLINGIGNSLFTQQPQIQVAQSFSDPKIPLSTIRVNVSSVDRCSCVTVNALFSTAAETSTISEPLAARLGIARGNLIFVSGNDAFDFTAALPSHHVDVECVDVVTSSSQTVVPKSTSVAFLIMPQPGNAMVLGMDWLADLAARTGRNVVLDFAPDKGRLRFPSRHDDPTTEEALRRFAEETDLDGGDFIAAPWGRPDPGPYYDPHPDAHDRSHHVRPRSAGRAMLDAIRDAD